MLAAERPIIAAQILKNRFVIYKGAISFFEQLRTRCDMPRQCLLACTDIYKMLFSISVKVRIVDVEKLRTFTSLGFVFAKPQADIVDFCL